MKQRIALALGFVCGMLGDLWAPINPSRLNVATEDGTVNTYPYKAKFTNGSVTDNNDGTVSIAITGSGGSSSLETMVNGVRLSSPTPSQNFVGTGVSGAMVGSTATITINGGVVVPSTFTWGLVNMSTFTASSATIATLNIGTGGTILNRTADGGIKFATTNNDVNYLYIRDAGSGEDNNVTAACSGLGGCVLDLTGVALKTGALTANQTNKFVTLDSGGSVSNYNLLDGTHSWTGGNTMSSVTVQNITINGTCTGSGCGTGSGIVSPGTFTWTNTQGISASTGVFTSTVTALSFEMTGTGNPSYQTVDDAEWYQVVGTSSTPTAGKWGQWSSSHTLIAVDAPTGTGGGYALEPATVPVTVSTITVVSSATFTGGVTFRNITNLDLGDGVGILNAKGVDTSTISINGITYAMPSGVGAGGYFNIDTSSNVVFTAGTGGVAWGAITGGNPYAQSDLATLLNNIGTSTASLKTQADAIAVDTGTINTKVWAVAADTGTINTKVWAVAADTGTIMTAVQSKTALSSFTATAPIVYNNATGALSATLISLSTGITGTLAAASVGNGLSDAQVADDITLTNITQITNRSHTSLSDIGTWTHAQIETVAGNKVNLASFTATAPIVYNNGTGAFSSTLISLSTGTMGNLPYLVSASTGLMGTLPVANGGTNLTASADDNVMVGNGTTWETKALTDCTGTGKAVTYATASNAFGCNTITATGGGLNLQPSTATINISSGLVLSGQAGTLGQYLKSGGPDTVPTWDTAVASVDTASTYTWTGGQIHNSYANYVGSVTYSSTTVYNNITNMDYTDTVGITNVKGVETSTATITSLTASQLVLTDANKNLVSASQITDTQIADGAVDGGTGGEIADDSITAADISADAVGESELLESMNFTATGRWDFGGSTNGMEIPNGTGPNVDAQGEIGVDTTNGQLVFHDGTAVRVVQPLESKCITIDTPTDADNFLWFKAIRAITIVEVNCVTNAATSAALTMQECGSSGTGCGTTEALSCTTTNASSTSIDDSVIDAGDWLRMDVGTVSGSVGHVSFCVEYYETAT